MPVVSLGKIMQLKKQKILIITDNSLIFDEFEEKLSDIGNCYLALSPNTAIQMMQIAIHEKKLFDYFLFPAEMSGILKDR